MATDTHDAYCLNGEVAKVLPMGLFVLLYMTPSPTYVESFSLDEFFSRLGWFLA